MGAQKDAKIRVGVEGVDEVARSADKALGPWEAATKRGGEAAGNWGSSIRNAVQSGVRDIVNLATFAQGVNFLQAIESSRTFTRTAGEMAAVTGQKADEVKQKINAISQSKLVPEQQVAAFIQSFGKLTYDARGAQDAVGAMYDEMRTTGESEGEVASLGHAMFQLDGSTGDASRKFGDFRGIAEAFHVPGGVIAMHEQFEALSGLLPYIKANVKDIAALSAGAPAGFKPEAAKQGLASVMSMIVRGGHETDRFYHSYGGLKKGESAFDENGQFKLNPIDAIEMERNARKKKFGANARRQAIDEMGPSNAAFLFDFDVDRARKAAGTDSSKRAEGVGQAYLDSKAGKDAAADLAAAKKKQELGDNLSDPARDLQNFGTEHPWLSFFGGKGLETAATGITAAVATGGGPAILAAAVASAPVVLPALAGSAAMVGTHAIDEATGFSDWASGQNDVHDDAERAFMADMQSNPAMSKVSGVDSLGDHIQDGIGDWISSKLTAALATAFSGMQLTVVNSTGGPVDVINQSGGGVTN